MSGLGASLNRDTKIIDDDEVNYGFNGYDYDLWYSFCLEGVLLG